jgi:hypothetical protein
MKSTLYKECGHYMRDMIVDGTHSLVECPTKPTFNIPETKSMTHLFRRIKGWKSNSFANGP